MSLPDRPLTRDEIEYVVDQVVDDFARQLGTPRDEAAAMLYAIVVALQERGITVVQAIELLKKPEPTEN